MVFEVDHVSHLQVWQLRWSPITRICVSKNEFWITLRAKRHVEVLHLDCQVYQSCLVSTPEPQRASIGFTK